jgi:hypothetical protein
MFSEERRKILQMVADGRINAQEAAQLMRSLDEPVEEQVEVISAGPGSRSSENADGEFEQVRRRALRWAAIPLWIGVLITVLSAWGMYSVQQSAGLNFWFFCLGMPFFLGILLIVMGAGGGSPRWMYVNVDRRQAGDWPKNITIALPLPLGLVGWFLKNFGNHIEGLRNTTVDEVLQALAMTKSIKEPLIVNVDESETGERVQVFIS